MEKAGCGCLTAASLAVVLGVIIMNGAYHLKRGPVTERVDWYWEYGGGGGTEYHHENDSAKSWGALTGMVMFVGGALVLVGYAIDARQRAAARVRETDAGHEGDHTVGGIHDLMSQSLERRNVRTLDGALLVFQDRDPNSPVVNRPPKGAEVRLGSRSEFQGREWLEAVLPDGRSGYVLGANARSHTG